MKNKLLFIAFIALSCVSFMACSSDDNDDGTSGDIVGKWSFDKEGGVFNGQEVLVAYPHSCPTKKDYIEFKSNGTGFGYYYDENCVLEDIDDEWGNWTLSGNILKISDSDGTISYEVLILNNSTLKIKATDSSVEGMIIQFLRM